ncbi:MAG: hypothetical protein H3C31_10340 [Brumimicrobium sp.]|nr:hypothetical protein [Brumimicrobium sp.]
MRKIFLILLLFIFTNIYSQINISPVVSLYEHNFRSSIFSELCDCAYVGDGFLNLGIRLGASYNLDKVQLSTFGTYQIETITSNAFQYNNHMLGLSVQSRFFNQRKFGLLISINGYGNIKTNYFLEFLDLDSYIAGHKPTPYIYGVGSHGGPPYITRYYSNFYINAPFVGNLLFGVDYKVFDGFHINLSAGFGMRIMKTKYAEWNKGDDYYKKLETIPVRTHYLSTMDFELGVSYAIPMKSGGGSKE